MSVPAFALDVGCGAHCQGARRLLDDEYGSAAVRFVLGVDASAEAARRAATIRGTTRRGLGMLDVIVADMTCLSSVLRDGLFDLVLCSYTLQHAREPLETLSAIVQHAVPCGGAVAVAVLCDQRPGLEAGPLPALLRGCYSSFLPPGALDACLRSSGCAVEWSDHRSSVYEDEGEFPCAREYAVARRHRQRHHGGMKRGRADEDDELPEAPRAGEDDDELEAGPHPGERE
eukprot:NODE_11192_length_1302_cov_4.937021.p2 GENE.NODE_11192_length_1302_cov_4.937021~~NODE_11192_length_1302_cov_4.937021.p2  ORF type:complete len:269 (-),score=66.54 NODE_11192_length_1302_cov_4.937021:495-1184(-)